MSYYDRKSMRRQNSPREQSDQGLCLLSSASYLLIIIGIQHCFSCINLGQDPKALCKIIPLYHYSLIIWYILLDPKHSVIKGLHCKCTTLQKGYNKSIISFVNDYGFEINHLLQNNAFEISCI